MLTGLSAATRQLLTVVLYDTLGDTSYGGTIHLFRNPFQPGPNAKLADFQECNFSGYGSIPGLDSWLPYLVPGSSDWSVQPNAVIDFNCGPVTEPQTAYGWYVTDHAGVTLFGWGVFSIPVVFSQYFQGILFVPQLFIPQSTGVSY